MVEPFYMGHTIDWSAPAELVALNPDDNDPQFVLRLAKGTVAEMLERVLEVPEDDRHRHAIACEEWHWLEAGDFDRLAERIDYQAAVAVKH